MAAMVQEVPDAEAAIRGGAGACGFCSPNTPLCTATWHTLGATSLRLADVNHSNEHGMTALHIACAGTGPKPMLDLLIAHKADVDAADKVRGTPMRLALLQPRLHSRARRPRSGRMDSHHVRQQRWAAVPRGDAGGGRCHRECAGRHGVDCPLSCSSQGPHSHRGGAPRCGGLSRSAGCWQWPHRRAACCGSGSHSHRQGTVGQPRSACCSSGTLGRARQLDCRPRCCNLRARRGQVRRPQCFTTTATVSSMARCRPGSSGSMPGRAQLALSPQYTTFALQQALQWSATPPVPWSLGPARAAVCPGVLQSPHHVRATRTHVPRGRRLRRQGAPGHVRAFTAT